MCTMSALNTLCDAVAASLKDWLGGSPAPAPKRHASADASSPAADQPSAHGKRPGKGQSSNSVSAEQNVWLRGALQASLGAFGEHVNARVDAVEVRIGHLEGGLQQVASGLADRQRETTTLKELRGAEIDKRDKTNDALRQSLEQLRLEFGAHKQSCVAASTAASENGGSVTTAAVVIGPLGWHTSAEELVERATALLAEALPDVHASLPLGPFVNQKGGGSAVATLLLVFMVPEARVRVKALRRSLPGAKGAAWSDHRRSQRDAASARMIHKLCEAVAELEEPRPDAHTIVKKVQARQLWTQSGQRVAWLHCLRVRWAPWALSR